MLLVGRALQGLGAAAASPASLGLLLAAVGDRERATYAARWTGAAALGMTLGPFVGGALTTLGDWRWAFLVNVPVVAAIARRHPAGAVRDARATRAAGCPTRSAPSS